VVAITPGVVVVSAIVLGALVLFATELVPVDVTAIGVLVTLLLVEPVTGVAAAAGLLGAPISLFEQYPQDALSGFASTATLTVLAMFILSEGVQRTGIIQIVGQKVAAVTEQSELKQLGATIGIVGPISGFINNTAAVAILLPMVTDLAERGNISPSKLLLPLSYASMFGGMLTLIGTSTNILASELSGRLIGRSFSMFEFTQLGIVVSIVGTIYLLTVGRYLVPARIQPRQDLTEEFQMADYLTEVVVREDSPLVGRQVQYALVDTDFDVDLLMLIREDEVFLEPLGPKEIHAGDIFALRTDRDTLVELLDVEGLDPVPVTVDESELEVAESGQNLVELVVSPGSSLVGESLASVNFRQRYNATVLALRRGEEIVRQRMDHRPLRVGDTLLVQATTATIERLDGNRDVIVAQEIERHAYRESKIPVALGIVVLVVALAALDFVPIVVSALAGALAMVLTRCLRPPELYDAVQWDVVFLLAGVIPLGIAMETSGAAALLADAVVMSANVLPLIAVLGVFYLVTALLTNVISNNASVVLMVPVAVEAARSPSLSADPFAFVLAVTFAASTAFMTPVGYQTNLFVYGPGGYRFSDYIRVGAPLQFLFAVVTTLGIAFFFGLRPA
jgi:di/tricarboxylate transporter